MPFPFIGIDTIVFPKMHPPSSGNFTESHLGILSLLVMILFYAICNVFVLLAFLIGTGLPVLAGGFEFWHCSLIVWVCSLDCKDGKAHL